MLLEHYDALPPGEPLPIRHAYILDPSGAAIVMHEGAVSIGADPMRVLEDCQWLTEQGWTDSTSSTTSSGTSGGPSPGTPVD